jgi:hypothetical protein
MKLVHVASIRHGRRTVRVAGGADEAVGALRSSSTCSRSPSPAVAETDEEAGRRPQRERCRWPGPWRRGKCMPHCRRCSSIQQWLGSCLSLSLYILTLFAAICFSCNLLIFCQEKEIHTIPFYPYTHISCLIIKWCLIIHMCASRLPGLIWVYL